MISLLMTAVLACSMFAGCGGNEKADNTAKENTVQDNTVTQNGTQERTDVTANKEADTSAGEENTAQRPGVAYKETTIAFLIENEADMDKALVDGSEVPNATVDDVQIYVSLKKTINLYNKNKEYLGYVKPDITLAYVELSEGWSIVSSTDYSEIYYALTAEADAVKEEVAFEESREKDMGLWTRYLDIEELSNTENQLNQNKLLHVYQQMVHVTENITVYNDYGIEWGYLHANTQVELYAYDEEWTAFLVEDGMPIYAKSKEVQEVLGEEYEDLRLHNWEGMTMDDMYAITKAAIEEAGLIYDESAFEGIDITLFETDNPPADYIRMPCSIVIEDREEVVPAFIEFLKGMHAGKKFILESVEIRGENYGEAPGNYYIFNIYMK